jgi:flagellar M-ring protein FliF
MDFLNKAYAQTADLFRSMTPGARITTALLLSIVIISLAYLFNQQVSGGDTYLLGGESFSSDELREMEAAFGTAQLPDYTIEGGRIRVPRGTQDVYLAALATSDALPANFDSILSKALNEGSALDNSDKSRERMQIATQRRTAMIIREMMDRVVETAAVTVGTRKQSGFKRGEVRTVGVSVSPRGDRHLNDEQVRAIQRFVADSFAVSLNDVSVTDMKHGEVLTAMNEDGSGSALDDPYFNLTMAWKDSYQSDIQRALSYIPGVTANVTVTLNKELSNVISSVKIDPKEIVETFRSEASTESSTQTTSPAGRPGLERQGGGLPNSSISVAPAGGPQTSTDDTTSTSQVSTFPTHDQTTKEFAGLTPENIAVAIQVPNLYLANLYRAENPPAAGEEPKVPTEQDLAAIRDREFAKVTDQVKKLITPIAPATANLDDLIAITSLGPMVVTAPAEEGMTEKAMLWFAQYWRTLGMFGLAAFSLIMLRSMIRSAPTQLPSAAASADSAATTSEEEDEEETVPKSQLKRRDRGGPSLTEELTSLVREDPDTAANILRSWITTAN